VILVNAAIKITAQTTTMSGTSIGVSGVSCDIDFGAEDRRTGLLDRFAL
jgi:hypothetical protein